MASNFNTTKIILPLIILCLLSTCYAYIVQTNAQKYVSPSQTSLILSTESLSGALFSVIMKMEPFTWYLGVAVVLFAIALALSELPIKQYFMNFKQKRTKKATPKNNFK